MNVSTFGFVEECKGTIAGRGSGEEVAIQPLKFATAPDDVYQVFIRMLSGFRNLGYPDHVKDPKPRIRGVQPISSWTQQIPLGALKNLSGLPYEDMKVVCEWVLDGHIHEAFDAKDKAPVSVVRACKLIDIKTEEFKKLVTFRY